MTGWLTTSPAVFAVFTVIIMGGAAFMTGQAVAGTWRPVRQAVAYSVLLGLTDRFLVFALFAYLPFSKLAHLVYRTVAMAYNEYAGRNF